METVYKKKSMFYLLPTICTGSQCWIFFPAHWNLNLISYVTASCKKWKSLRCAVENIADSLNCEVAPSGYFYLVTPQRDIG